jgi:phosphoserine phosphatase
LRRECDTLKTTIYCSRRQLENKQGYAARLELVLRLRTQTVDELNAKLEAARAANHRLEDECEHLVKIVRAEGAQISKS